MSRNLYVTWPMGVAVDPLEILPEQIYARDMAHHLSIENRYGGGTRVPLPVAEHSLAVSSLAALRAMHTVGSERTDGIVRIAAQWGLVHDGFEYIGKDLPRGFKHRPEIRPFYSAAEEAFLRKMAARFGLPWPCPKVVFDVDREICGTEMRQLCRLAIDPDGGPLPPAIPGIVMGVMSAAEAETRWLARFIELWGPDADDLLGVAL